MEDFLDLDISLPSGVLSDSSIELDFSLFDNLPDPDASQEPIEAQGGNFNPFRDASTPIPGVVCSSKLFHHLKLAATKPTPEQNPDSSIQEDQETSEMSVSLYQELLDVQPPQQQPQPVPEGMPLCSSVSPLAATNMGLKNTATQSLPTQGEQPTPKEEFNSSLEYAELMKAFCPSPEQERSDSPPLDYALLMNPLRPPADDESNLDDVIMNVANAQGSEEGDSPDANLHCSSVSPIAATNMGLHNTATTQPLPTQGEQPTPEEDFNSSLEYAKLMKAFCPSPEKGRSDSPLLDYALNQLRLPADDQSKPDDATRVANVQSNKGDSQDLEVSFSPTLPPLIHQQPTSECSVPVQRSIQSSTTSQYIMQEPPNCLSLQREQQVVTPQPLTTQPQLQYQAYLPSQCAPLENKFSLGSVPSTTLSQQDFSNAHPHVHHGARNQPPTQGNAMPQYSFNCLPIQQEQHISVRKPQSQLQYEIFQAPPSKFAPLEFSIGSVLQTAVPSQDFNATQERVTTQQPLPTRRVLGSVGPQPSLLAAPSCPPLQPQQHHPAPAVPVVLPQEGVISTQSSHTQPRMSKQILSANIGRLIQRLEACANILPCDELRTFYEAQVSKLEESQRIQMSQCKSVDEEVCIDVSHTSIHNELIHSCHQTLDQVERRRLSQAASSVETSTSTGRPSPASQPASSSSSTSVQQSSPDGPSTAQPSPPAPFNPAQAATKASSKGLRIPSVAELRTYKQKSIIESLSSKATDALNKWYADNYATPYASEDEVAELANRGDILPVQVRKWLCNKRRRDNNYLNSCEQAMLKIRKRKRSGSL
ncbi:hypothetical protein CAPTEDRAFT_195060 [Capitella teleta]|uniref:Homeobox domain-containing protein n=1 Tax=Capitella teleta TaxID=283909 RepID=R7UPQ3_CAPTE|nr:hypothetical protein CAPTEDRAFT_195060 [Capitella teleta]|eukprot:ELU05932.1 hypothetical protein CAPTEDRAFT_195060 [Capitella teleta]